MTFVTSRMPLILACLVLAGVAVLLVGGRLEYCGRSDALQPRMASSSAAKSPSPTLAPPQSVVFVQVEADKPDIEVSWAEN